MGIGCGRVSRDVFAKDSQQFRMPHNSSGTFASGRSQAGNPVSVLDFDDCPCHPHLASYNLDEYLDPKYSVVGHLETADTLFRSIAPPLSYVIKLAAFDARSKYEQHQETDMPSQPTAVLVEKFGHAFSGYDLATGERRFSVALPEYPHEFVVDHGGRFGYVGHYGVQTFAHAGRGGYHVFVIDIQRGEHALTLNCEPYSRIHGLQIDSRDRVYALSEQDNMLLVFADPHARQVPDRAVPSGGIKSHLFVVSRDGERAYISNLLSHTVTRVHPYDASLPPVAVNAGGRPEGCCLSHDETVLFIASRDDHTLSMIDTETMQVIRTVVTGEDPTRIYLTPDRRLLVVNYGERSIRVFDPESLEALGRVDTVAKPIAVSFHPDGRLAYVALNDNSVGVLDLDAMTLERGFPVGKEPDGLAILAL